MTNILVTGGAGYIGSHACKALARAGHTPVVYDNLSRGHRELVKWGPLEIGDIRDSTRLCEVLDRYRPAGVIHFAALAYVGESVGDPSLYYSNNVVGSLSLLDAMRICGVGRLVFSSSCATYGVPERVPIDEAQRQNPISPYGVTKLTVERLIADYSEAYGLRAVCLRYFNAAGADPDGETGELHDPETHAVPLVIEAALTGTPFRIFGTDYDTDDGTAVRDYVHVADLASAHVDALGYLIEGGRSTAVNLGTGVGLSVRQLIDSVGAVTGLTVPTLSQDRRPGDPPVMIASHERARAILGWEPKHSTIDEIVRTAVLWRLRDRELPAADLADRLSAGRPAGNRTIREMTGREMAG